MSDSALAIHDNSGNIHREAELTEDKSVSLDQIIYKGLLRCLVLVSIIMLVDSWFPVKSKQDTILSKSPASNHSLTVYSKGFQFEATTAFYDNVNERMPITVTYTPFLNMPVMVKGFSKADDHHSLECANQSTMLTKFWIFPSIVLFMAIIGLSIYDAQGKEMFFAVSFFFMTIVLYALYQNL
jgi:hypothetical protein